MEENAFENAVWKMAAILSKPQSVKSLRAIEAYVWTKSANWVIFGLGNNLLPAWCQAILNQW